MRDVVRAAPCSWHSRSLSPPSRRRSRGCRPAWPKRRDNLAVLYRQQHPHRRRDDRDTLRGQLLYAGLPGTRIVWVERWRACLVAVVQVDCLFAKARLVLNPGEDGVAVGPLKLGRKFGAKRLDELNALLMAQKCRLVWTIARMVRCGDIRTVEPNRTDAACCQVTRVAP
jgi:hypothetical protein